MRRTSRIGLAAAITAVAAATALAGLAPSAAATTPVVRASLNFATPEAGKTVTTLTVGGAYYRTLTASVVTLNGGKAVSTVSGVCCNNAIDFPGYVARGSQPPLAVVAIKNKTSSLDPLNGGTGSFTWQADFSLDDNVGTDALDGDNLLQRGLSPQKQWKLSVDKHAAQCFVRTVANAAAVVTPVIHIPNQTTNVRWYRAICNRSATGVLSLRVYARSISAGTWVAFGTSTAADRTVGDLNMTWTTPVSVGGKLSSGTTIATSPAADQFNGRVDNVIITLG
ncbi:MAG: hypothetical protein ACJ71T_02430 [Actinomycetales bacterium]